jgi:hypothetical protein
MKALHCSLKSIVSLLACTLLMIVSAVQAEAIIIVNSKSGMIGVTGSQTLRINIANVGDEVSGIQPYVIVFDTLGNELARFDGDPLFSGKAASFDFSRPPDDGRTELRVVIQLEDREEVSSKRLKGRVRTTLEVFDNATGGTVAIIDDGKLSD